MCKQDKSRFTFSKRYFALYEGGLLAYYSHERAFQEDVKKHEGVVRDDAIIYTQAYLDLLLFSYAELVLCIIIWSEYLPL